MSLFSHHPPIHPHILLGNYIYYFSSHVCVWACIPGRGQQLTVVIPSHYSLTTAHTHTHTHTRTQKSPSVACNTSSLGKVWGDPAISSLQADLSSFIHPGGADETQTKKSHLILKTFCVTLILVSFDNSFFLKDLRNKKLIPQEELTSQVLIMGQQSPANTFLDLPNYFVITVIISLFSSSL